MPLFLYNNTTIRPDYILFYSENVDLSVLWGTIKESLPDLQDKLKDILVEEKEELF